MFTALQNISFFLFRSILFSLIAFSFQGCLSNGDKFLSSEKCCTQYILDRKEFLDSLFLKIFEPDSIKTENFFEQYEVENNGHEIVLVWRSFPKKKLSYQENFYASLLDKKNNWSLQQYPVRDDEPINGRSPKYKVTLRYKPDSTCLTLTEQWLFVSQHLYQYDNEYFEDYVIFQYNLKLDELFSKSSRNDIEDNFFESVGLQSIKETNDTNIVRANQYGNLKFEILMNSITQYLQKSNDKNCK